MQRMMKKRQLSLGPVLFFPPHLGVFGEIFLGDADENKHYVARFFTQKECMPWEFSGDFRLLLRSRSSAFARNGEEKQDFPANRKGQRMVIQKRDGRSFGHRIRISP